MEKIPEGGLRHHIPLPAGRGWAPRYKCTVFADADSTALFSRAAADGASHTAFFSADASVGVTFHLSARAPRTARTAAGTVLHGPTAASSCSPEPDLRSPIASSSQAGDYTPSAYGMFLLERLRLYMSYFMCTLMYC